MKMMRLPQEYIEKVQEYVRLNHIKVKNVERFRTMETQKVYTDNRFFAIVSYLFNLIASGKKSEFTYSPQQFHEVAKKEIVPVECEIKEEEQFLKITVIKSVPVEKIFTQGRVFEINKTGLVDKYKVS
jgi:hypothetical protein